MKSPRSSEGNPHIEDAHPPPAARPGAPPDDEGDSEGDRGDRQSDALRGGDPVFAWSRRGAPKVVAKGKNYLAAAHPAKRHRDQVPIVENPPLAQALYKSVEVGQEIPAHLYRAVAEILAYIYRLMNGRLPG